MKNYYHKFVAEIMTQMISERDVIIKNLFLEI